MRVLLGAGWFSICRYPCVNVAELHTAPHLLFFFGAGWKRVSAFCWASIGWTGAVETGWGKTKKEHYRSFDVDREEFIGLTVSSSNRGAGDRKCLVGEASGRAPSDSSGSREGGKKPKNSHFWQIFFVPIFGFVYPLDNRMIHSKQHTASRKGLMLCE